MISRYEIAKELEVSSFSFRRILFGAEMCQLIFIHYIATLSSPLSIVKDAYTLHVSANTLAPKT